MDTPQTRELVLHMLCGTTHTIELPVVGATCAMVRGRLFAVDTDFANRIVLYAAADALLAEEEAEKAKQ